MKKLIVCFLFSPVFFACKNDRTESEAGKIGMVAGMIDEPQAVQNESDKEVYYVRTSSGTYQAKTVQKKGWSKAAKGAVIGAGAGAIAGAVISKKPVKGAVIGGVIGAGAGYVIGRSKDKKDGRVKQ